MTGDVTERIGRLYEAKARAELKAADAGYGAPVRVTGSGTALAGIVLLAGVPGPEDVAARRALTGAVGEAASKALERLGLDPSDTYAVCTRPAPAEPAAVAHRVEMIVEAVDPRLVIALDPDAAHDLAAAYGLASVIPGAPAVARGRTLAAVGDLGASLADPGLKPQVWAAFKALRAALG